MHYEGNMIRPPSEANSILLQVTVGCSHNKCTFCGTYTNERFRIKSDDIISSDIDFAATYCKRQRRVFLCDGDALIIPQKRLLKILKEIKAKLPWVTRIGTYANVKSLKLKSFEELQTLKKNGLDILYMGLETGDDTLLAKIRKGFTAETAIRMGKIAKDAGFKLSITVLLGIAGRNASQRHAQKTGEVLSAIDPDYVGALSLMLLPGTPLYNDHVNGKFPILRPKEVLRELRTMIEHTHLNRGLFHANHASNYLPIRARFPKDREGVLALIDHALAGGIQLKPEYLRAL